MFIGHFVVALIMFPIIILLLISGVFGIQIHPAFYVGIPISLISAFFGWVAYNVWQDKKKENAPQATIRDSLQPAPVQEMIATIVVR